MKKFLIGLVVLGLVGFSALVSAAPFPAALGGRGTSTLPFKGGIDVGVSTSSFGSLATGTNGFFLMATSGAAFGIAWQQSWSQIANQNCSASSYVDSISATGTVHCTGLPAGNATTTINGAAAQFTFTIATTSGNPSITTSTSGGSSTVLFTVPSGGSLPTPLALSSTTVLIGTTTTASSVTYAYTGATSSLTIPNDVDFVKIELTAGGGGGGDAGGTGMAGGAPAWIGTSSSTAQTTSTMLLFCGGGSGGGTNSGGGAAGLGLSSVAPDTYGGAAVGANTNANPGTCFFASSFVNTSTGSSGGGGGNNRTGGGGGAATGTVPVVPGTVYWYNLGLGGAGSPAPADNGATSTLKITYFRGDRLSNPNAGSVQLGASTSLPFYITWSTPFTSIPACTLTANTSTYGYVADANPGISMTTSSMWVNVGTFSNNMKVMYHCF